MEGRDLDSLIGGIREEAAARRAAPDFPVDDEAETALELDANAPHGPGPDLEAIALRLRQIETSGPDALDAAVLAEMAGLTASAARAAGSRLAQLERRTARLVGPPGAGRVVWPDGGDGGAGGLSAEDDQSLERLLAARLPLSGEVLVAGRGAARWAQRWAPLAPPGMGEVRSVDPASDGPGDGALHRGGPVIDHLRDHGSGSLGLVVLGGLYGPGELAEIDDVVAEVARVAAAAVVVSVSPWWWRRSRGDGAVTAPRPVEVDSWLEVLAGVGWEAAVQYGPGARWYLVDARAGESGPGSGPV